MIDALLYAVRDGIRGAGFGYDIAACEIMDDGRPPPRAGNVFVAVHSGKAQSNKDNQLFEEYSLTVTLTMRVTIPLDRVGDQLIARNLALVPLAQRQGFNARVEQLRTMLHMNWRMVVMTAQSPPSANDNLSAWATGIVYGFSEPFRYRGPTTPELVGGDWFGADPEDEAFGIKADLQFEGAKRMQPQTLPVGPFV